MIARASQLYLPTLRDAPADADAVSHKLLVRAGFIRQIAAGLWSFTPLGWRVHRKIEHIIREEMDAIGAQEWLPPAGPPRGGRGGARGGWYARWLLPSPGARAAALPAPADP